MSTLFRTALRTALLEAVKKMGTPDVPAPLPRNLERAFTLITKHFSSEHHVKLRAVLAALEGVPWEEGSVGSPIMIVCPTNKNSHSYALDAPLLVYNTVDWVAMGRQADGAYGVGNHPNWPGHDGVGAIGGKDVRLATAAERAQWVDEFVAHLPSLGDGSLVKVMKAMALI